MTERVRRVCQDDPALMLVNAAAKIYSLFRDDGR